MTHESHVSVKTGLPPGIPIYIGKQEPNRTTLSAIIYTELDFQIIDNIHPDDLKKIKELQGICWIHITGLQDIDTINSVLSFFSLHPLIAEDIFNTKGRAKIEDFGDSLFIVLDMVLSSSEQWQSQKINIITKDNLLISVAESGDPFENIRVRVTHPNGKFRTYGTDYLMYSLIDSIVDTYFFALEKIEESAEELEERVVHDPKPDIIRDIQTFRHNLIRFKRQVWSLREVIMHLERSDSNILSDSIRIFMRDVYDHVIKISEDLDVHREMAEGIMEIYLSSVSNRTNEIVRVLTVIAVIFIPLTFITGVYGMNFAYLPGINHPLGHLIIFGMMLVITIGMAVVFKFKKWI
ncbi:magnesium/cobalt transporter CorA [Methanospirillum purgamenti]|uniref:Magnesium transport protein CorA n=1 Tax=Methanospirillum hungatei TaxID=2203 RepID=A0A8F5VPA3_METHU|nr:magnesium/cobalt transporter CorA [Methanospirillum hungatei]NLW75261.1 magnesium/cobalt transporter CorA [Methanomicrobiales archaeon]QXO94950.1 magnesium/cobalt transporter CorA [Methanospirillum hungatei]